MERKEAEQILEEVLSVVANNKPHKCPEDEMADNISNEQPEEGVQEKIIEKIADTQSVENKITDKITGQESKKAHIQLSETRSEQLNEEEYSPPYDDMDNEETISDEEAMEQDMSPDEELKLLVEDSEMTLLDHIYYSKHLRRSLYRSISIRNKILAASSLSQTTTSLDNPSTSTGQQHIEAPTSCATDEQPTFIEEAQSSSASSVPINDAQRKRFISDTPPDLNSESLPSSSTDVSPINSTNEEIHSTSSKIVEASFNDVEPCSSTLDVTSPEETAIQGKSTNRSEEYEVIDLCDETPPSSPISSSDCEIIDEVYTGDSDLKRFYMRYIKPGFEGIHEQESEDDEDYKPLPKMKRFSRFKRASSSGLSQPVRSKKTTCRLSDIEIETYLTEAEVIIKTYTSELATEDDSAPDTTEQDTYNPMALHCLSRSKYDVQAALKMLKKALEDLHSSSILQRDKQEKNKDNYDKPEEDPNKEPNQ